ncbi:MAG: fasciclin domain-containing protein, partial [Bacteroidales bacterium]
MKTLLTMAFAATMLLQVKAQELSLSDFDSGSLAPFYTWGAPLTIEANPDGTAEDSVALLDQSANAWSGIAAWFDDGKFFAKIDSITVDVYLNAAGAIQFYAGNSISGVDNFTQFIGNVPAQTWTTYTFDMADLPAYDFKQFAVQYSIADKIYFDNFKVYGSPTVVDIIVESEDHTTLETAVVEAGLADAFSTLGSYTVFAPTDDAFAALPEGVLDDLLADPTGDLANILLYHVLEGEVMSTDLSDGMTATTMLGKDITVTISGSDVFINDAQVTVADVQAFNGVVHVIDAVLTPPTTVVDVIVGSPDHETLETAVLAAELDDDLNVTGPFTVFAPTDDAFAALPDGVLADLLVDPTGDLANILLYHVVAGKAMSTDLSDGQIITTLYDRDIEVTISGSDVFINNAQVTVADIEADNGVVHVIDAVLTPPPYNVVDVVVESPDHETLETAVVAAGLVETLNGEGPFTVFAPTDDAFAALPEGTLDALLADPSGDLTDILLYHVVAGQAMSTDLSDGQVIETVLGKNITVTINDDGVFINNAKVTVVDLEADNGVVHVIDAVLLPPADVRVMEDDTYGKIITDHAGNTLYFFTRDADGTSACTGGCLDNWPIFYAEDPSVEAELNADDFGSIDRGDGVMQTTYKGWPLYYFANDANPGDTEGEGVIDSWFVAKPDYTIMLVDNQLVGNDGNNYTGDYTLGDEVIQYFTDGMGVTLYTWVNDDYLVNNFTSEDFSNNGVWPIYEEEQIVVPSVLNAEDFAVIDVYDRKQLTYKGWPLYYFGQDMMMRGDTKGVSVPSPGIWPVAVQDMMPDLPATVVDIIVNSENHETLEAAVLATSATETIEDFDGEGNPAITAFGNIVANEIIANPDPSGINVSDTVVKFTKTAGSETWAGAFFEPGFVMDFDTYSMVKMKTWSPKVGAEVRFKIENQDNSISYETPATTATTVANAWEELTFDMSEAPDADYVRVVVFFDFGVAGDDSEYYYDDIRLSSTDLASVLMGEGPFTVFAPTDDAFAALPDGTLDALLADPSGALTDVLLYHVVAGKAMSTDLSDGQEIETVLGQNITVTINNDGVFINDAQVTVADIEAANGVVHVIDAVLVPEMMPATVVDIIVNSEVHETLEAAVIAADLVETLQGEGPFTVFAPTDDAFAALPEGTLDALLADPSGDLTDILLYHVVAGKAMSTDLSDGQEIETVLEQNITVTINNDGVFINDAQVTVADIEAGNGVVHVIDAVLMPELMPETVVDIIVASEDHETLEAAVIAANLVETLQGDGPFTVFAPTDDAFAA